MTKCAIALLLVGLAHGLKISSDASSSASDPEGKPVFYAIVMGKLAYRNQVSLWLSSLRKLGGFKDEVVLITDKPTCLAKTLTEAKLLGAQISSDDHVDIYGPGEGYVGNTHLMKRPEVGPVKSPKDTAKMKIEKTRAWTNVELAAIPHPVSSIIYTDEDVTVGKDLTEFISTVRTLEKAKHTIALFRDTGASAGELHTGVVAMFPGEGADRCLQSWGKHLKTFASMDKPFEAKPKKAWTNHPVEVHRKKKNGLKGAAEEADMGQEKLTEAEAMEQGMQGIDQWALASSKECTTSGGQDGVSIFPAKYFLLPTAAALKSGKKAEFVHFTNTKRWKSIPADTIKSYLVKIGIPAHIDVMGHVQDKTCASEVQ